LISSYHSQYSDAVYFEDFSTKATTYDNSKSARTKCHIIEN